MHILLFEAETSVALPQRSDVIICCIPAPKQKPILNNLTLAVEAESCRERSRIYNASPRRKCLPETLCSAPSHWRPLCWAVPTVGSPPSAAKMLA